MKSSGASLNPNDITIPKEIEPMPRIKMNKPLEEDICIHLFSVSAAMVGVCLTVIGIIRVVISVQQIDTLADDLLSVDALFFLCSCLCAYWALRMRNSRRIHFLERIADGAFILGLILMVAVCSIIGWAIF
jgi:hypothetical protein